MSTLFHALGYLLVFAAMWIAFGIALFAPAPGGRPGVIPGKYFGWWIYGYWAAVACLGLAWLAF